MMPSEFSEESFELYRKYQMAVHKEPFEKITEHSYQTFLCASPLTSSVGPSILLYLILDINCYFFILSF